MVDVETPTAPTESNPTPQPVEENDDLPPEIEGEPPILDIFQSTKDSFSSGDLSVLVKTFLPSDGAPTEVSIFYPEPSQVNGKKVSMIYFNHGFLVSNQNYTKIKTYLASHGFIVLSSQMYARDAIPFGKPSIADETILATELIQWSIENVEGLTGLTLAPSIGLAGHSRGGQVVWRIANSKIFSVSALVSFDPVDSNGMDANSKITASTLAKVTSLTIGTGLGPETFLGQACAPEGFNYKDFFAATDSGIKSYQLLASSYGHMDMLDESCGLICNVCVAANPNNFPRDDFIGLASGSAVAIFKERLQSIKGEEQAFMNKFRGNKNFIATMK